MVLFLVVLARILGFMIVAPFFGSMNIPMTARVGFSLVLTAATVPFVKHDISASLALELKSGGAFDLLLLLVNQVLIGLMLGFCASFIFYAIESAGRIIDTQRGSNITDIIAPQTGERTSPTGQWLMMVALMILLVSGLHMEMISGLLNTFKIFPPTASLGWIGDPLQSGAAHPSQESVISAFAQMSGDSLLLTLQIAAPAMMTLLLTDVLLGIINRGAPQVNVFALSQVVKGPIGIAAIMVALLPTWGYLRDHAIPSIVDGDRSISTLAEKMHESDVDAKRIARANSTDTGR
ncbi:MAG: flagellar biosynthetic protein FliR/type secretion protein SpaR/YscT/HrcT [Thermoleophilia bacterium]|nr:flagellar biosynthetic protein FliR/type secretion protein SpaR/YscT/HrcT [Thermoleophilia bacterium]MCZ4497102.1 flagellar biosynthetic protein FliR/type secretion protein SpaR/YscT/HrcT [Thermoleophilia bacterium]